MKRKITVLLLSFVFGGTLAQAALPVKVVQLQGDVRIRRGVEEKWQAAAQGMLLEEIDTIMTLEGAEVVLELGNRTTFRLAGNAILEVADLREITERELFLILMSEKVGKLAPRSEKVPLRIGAVSSVRGAPFQNSERGETQVGPQLWRMEANAAQALQSQNFLPNAAMKLHRVKEKFPARQDCGEVSYELAQVWENLRQTGRARDEYQAALRECQTQKCEDAAAQKRMLLATAALQRLH